jgi:hypothetical protein
MSAKLFMAFGQGMYLTFEAVVTNVGILPLNIREFCCLNCQLVRHNLQLTANSGQIKLFRTWNWMQLQMSAMYTFRQRIWSYSSRPGSRNKAVGRVTKLWTGRSGVYCWPEEEIFSMARLAAEPMQLPIQSFPGLFPVGNATGHGVDHWPHTRVEVNVWSYISNPPVCPHDMDKDYFTLITIGWAYLRETVNVMLHTITLCLLCPDVFSTVGETS